MTKFINGVKFNNSKYLIDFTRLFETLLHPFEHIKHVRFLKAILIKFAHIKIIEHK